MDICHGLEGRMVVKDIKPGSENNETQPGDYGHPSWVSWRSYASPGKKRPAYLSKWAVTIRTLPGRWSGPIWFVPADLRRWAAVQ
jgi:hypothetical protein